MTLSLMALPRFFPASSHALDISIFGVHIWGQHSQLPFQARQDIQRRFKIVVIEVTGKLSQ